MSFLSLVVSSRVFGDGHVMVFIVLVLGVLGAFWACGSNVVIQLFLSQLLLFPVLGALGTEMRWLEAVPHWPLGVSSSCVACLQGHSVGPAVNPFHLCVPPCTLALI